MTEQNETEEAYPKPADRFHVVSTCSICREEVSIVLGVSLPRTLSCCKCGLVLAAAKPVGGYVYVLSNKCMPNLVKIGFSTREVESRVAELNSSTSIPEPFKLEASFPVEHPLKQEAVVHAKLAEYRHSENREFFRLQVPDAITAVRQSLLNELAIEVENDSEGAVQIFKSEIGRGVIVKISSIGSLSGSSKIVRTPKGQSFSLAATFIVSNHNLCAAAVTTELAHRRDGFGIWDVSLDEALNVLVKVTRKYQKNGPISQKKSEGSADSIMPEGAASRTPIVPSGSDLSNGKQILGGFGSTRYK